MLRLLFVIHLRMLSMPRNVDFIASVKILNKLTLRQIFLGDSSEHFCILTILSRVSLGWILYSVWCLKCLITVLSCWIVCQFYKSWFLSSWFKFAYLGCRWIASIDYPFACSSACNWNVIWQCISNWFVQLIPVVLLLMF